MDMRQLRYFAQIVESGSFDQRRYWISWLRQAETSADLRCTPVDQIAASTQLVCPG